MEDISSIIKELSDAFSGNDIPDNLKEIVSNLNSNTKNEESNNENSNFNMDMDMIFKIKKIMEEMSDNSDPRKSLLMSLKPYLKNEKKEKIDQYVKFLGIAKIIQVIGPEFLGSDKNG